MKTPTSDPTGQGAPAPVSQGTPAAASTPPAPAQDPKAAPAAPGTQQPPQGAGGDGKPADAKGQPPAADAAPAGGLKLPEGVQVAPKVVEAFAAAAKGVGLDDAKAQQLADAYLTAVKEHEGQLEKKDQELRQKWAAELKADKELGGTNLDATRAAAAKAIERFGGKELAEFVKAAGLEDHPALVKAFARAGQKISEDSIAGSQSNAGDGLTAEERALRKRYPTMFTK